MGIMMNKNLENRDELSRRIDADLKAKMEGSARAAGENEVDLAEDSEYVQNFKKTGRFAWVWVLIGVVAVAILVAIGMMNKN